MVALIRRHVNSANKNGPSGYREIRTGCLYQVAHCGYAWTKLFLVCK